MTGKRSRPKRIESLPPADQRTTAGLLNAIVPSHVVPVPEKTCAGGTLTTRCLALDSPTVLGGSAGGAGGAWELCVSVSVEGVVAVLEVLLVGVEDGVVSVVVRGMVEDRVEPVALATGAPPLSSSPDAATSAAAPAPSTTAIAAAATITALRLGRRPRIRRA
jgi:hypothetical protein